MYMEERKKSDEELLDVLVNELHEPTSGVDVLYDHEVDTRQEIDVQTPLEYLVVGTKGTADYDEQVYYITEFKYLWCYSFVNNETKKPKLKYTFENRIMVFKVFLEGEVILLGGEKTDTVKSLQLLRRNKDGEYEQDTNYLYNLNVADRVYKFKFAQEEDDDEKGKFFLTENTDHMRNLDEQTKFKILMLKYDPKWKDGITI